MGKRAGDGSPEPPDCAVQAARGPFTGGRRADIFNHYKEECSDQDWWCILDADEFYIDDPRVFLAKVPPHQGVVVSASFSYYLTDIDARLYEQDPGRYADSVPVFDRCRYYLNNWSEIRFFRHARDLNWSRDDGNAPIKTSEWHPYPARIWLQHYAYRSPNQIDKRLATRSAAIMNGKFVHEALPDWASIADPDSIVADPRRRFSNSDSRYTAHGWRERLGDASKLDYDAGDRKWVVRENLMPPVPHRSPAAVSWLRAKRWLAAKLGRSGTMRRVMATYRARRFIRFSRGPG